MMKLAASKSVCQVKLKMADGRLYGTSILQRDELLGPYIRALTPAFVDQEDVVAAKHLLIMYPRKGVIFTLGLGHYWV